MKSKPNLISCALDAKRVLFTTDVAEPKLLTPETFARLWELRPAAPQHIRMAGRLVELPRRQKAYAWDYAFSGTVSAAADLPGVLAPFREWARDAVGAAERASP